MRLATGRSDQSETSPRSLPLRLFFAALPVLGVLLLGWDGVEIITYFWASSAAVLITLPVFMRQAAQRTGDKFVTSPDPGTTDTQLYTATLVIFIVCAGIMLAHLVGLSALSLVNWSVLPGAVVVQTVRRYVFERGGETMTASDIFSPLATMHLVIVVTGGLTFVLERRSVVAVALLCAASVAAELRGTRPRRR